MRRYKLVHERIRQEEKRLQVVYEGMPIKGKDTRSDTQKRVLQEMRQMTFLLARECNVLVNYPELSIQGTKVVLGPPSIMLPSCRFVSYEELRDLEISRIRAKQEETSDSVDHTEQGSCGSKQSPERICRLIHSSLITEKWPEAKRGSLLRPEM